MPRARAGRARREDRIRVVFWPFGLFGNPGAESGVEQLGEDLLERFAAFEADPGCRQHGIVERAKVEVRRFIQVGDYLTWRRDVRRRFTRCLRERELPVFVGGNHLVALPVYEEYSALPERVCVVCFDAHLDAYDLPESKEALHHGNFLLHLAKGPRLSIVNVGHRDTTLGRRQVREFFDRDFGIEAIVARPLDRLVRELARYLRGFDRVHFDIDLDVLDPSVLRAVGSPMPCGLAAQQLLALLDGLWTPKLSGITLSEYNGALDPDGSGRQLVLWLLEHLLLKRVEAGASR